MSDNAKSIWTALPSAPAGTSTPSFSLKGQRPAARWIYTNAQGEIAGIVCRFDLADGKSERITLVWCKDQFGKVAFRPRAMIEPRPIYGQDQLTESFVVIAESEPSAEAITATGIPSTTFSGGIDAVKKSDLSPLEGKICILWIDGNSNADLVAALSPLASEIRIVKNPEGKSAVDCGPVEIKAFIDLAAMVNPANYHKAESSEEAAEAIGIPPDIFPIPAGGISYTDAARIIFPAIAEKRRLFMRDRLPHEIAPSEENDYLFPLTPERFCYLLGTYGKRVARREAGTGKQEGKLVWRNTNFPISAAKILLCADEAGANLPAIRQLANCPILTTSGEVIGRGYHGHAGGTYISRGQTPPNVPLDAATTALAGLLKDFAFVTEADRARALASLISPALKTGGWIRDDFPLDVAEADQSQSGKTYRQKLVSRLYAETPSSITSPKGGVGSVDEAVATALIKGRPFVTLDNFRGKLDSTILEEAIRGHGRVTCRALRTSAEVDCTPFLWQLSTNGAELTRDLANRSIITRIRKQAPGYTFQTFPSGDLLAHVQANQPFFLGAIFTVIREWARVGCPRTSESRHDFRGWCQALDWITQNVFGTPPLLDGHREEQQRTANPALQWLRDILLAARQADFGRELNTGGLLAIAEDGGIEFPGNPSNKDDPAIRAGRILGKIFREAESDRINVYGFIFERTEAPDYTETGCGRVVKKYTITKP